MSSPNEDVGDDAPALYLFVDHHTGTHLFLLVDEQIYRRVWPLSVAEKQLFFKLVLSIFHVLTHPPLPPMPGHFESPPCNYRGGLVLKTAAHVHAPSFSHVHLTSHMQGFGESRATSTVDVSVISSSVTNGDGTRGLGSSVIRDGRAHMTERIRLWTWEDWIGIHVVRKSEVVPGTLTKNIHSFVSLTEPWRGT